MPKDAIRDPGPRPLIFPSVRSAWRGAAVIGALLCAAFSSSTADLAATPRSGSDFAGPTAGPNIEIDDVYRFYKIYEAAGGRPTAEVLQHDYLDNGSPGLRIFAERRRITGERIAQAIAARPEIYANAKRCVETLPRVRQRLAAALRELARLYPEAQFPAVTIAIGRGKPVGIGSPTTGVQIGLEALCATDFLNPNLEDRFVYVIAHEFVHAQQAQSLVDSETLTVLEASLVEGVAEFVTELISGDVAYSHLKAVVAGREKEIETDFLTDLDKKDLSDWLYNGTAEKPGDLGYWVGYRIAKAYYLNAADKRVAIREIVQMTDANTFLAASGWRPGIEFK